MIRIGTRGSKLALWQTNYVADLLNKAGLETEVVTIETKGDKILNASFAEIGTKGLFTEELEEKLISKEVDIAVHSAKDMQTQLGEGLEIMAYTKREKPCDVLVSLDKTFSLERPGKKIIGTSSTRRRSILSHYYPEAEATEARGNLQTRFRKLEEGRFEAMILAYAGVHRMELDEHIVQELPLHIFTPAVGQGSVAIEAAKNLDPDKRAKIREALNDAETEICLLTERAFLKKLEGGCSIPVFGLAELSDGKVKMSGGVISLDGKEQIRERITGSIEEPEKAGLQLAEQLLAAGGDKILAEIKKERR